jgi:hypothetical protein
LLIIWMGIVFSGGVFVQVLMGFIAGWTIGGWIYAAATKVFPE